MASLAQIPDDSSWLEQTWSRRSLDWLYANVTRIDILRIINNYNSIRLPVEHICVASAPECHDFCKNRGAEWVADEQDNKILPTLNEVIDEDSQTHGEVLSMYPSLARTPSPSPAGDNAPLWLGMPGFEQHTTEFFERIGPDEPLDTYPPIFTEEEEGRDQELAALKGHTIEHSKTRLLDLLYKLLGDLEKGIEQMNDGIELVLEGVMSQAKGKCPKIDKDEPVEFTSLLEYQESVLKKLKTSEDVLMYAWWCYSNQCRATDTDVDRDVVAAARTIMGLVEKSNEVEQTGAGSCFETITVASADPKDSKENGKDDEVEKLSTEAEESKVPAGYEALKVLSEQDEQFPSMPRRYCRRPARGRE